MYINKLDYIVNKYNDTHHRSIKMEPFNVKSSTYIDTSQEINDKDPKVKIGDIVKTSKYKNIFVKDYAPNWSKEGFVVEKVNALCHGHVVLVILMEKKLLESFIRKRIARNNLIKRKVDNLYV